MLHRRKYRETSAILEILSLQYGRISCLLKGAFSDRKNSPARTLQAFRPLQIGWVGKTDLPTVTKFEVGEQVYSLEGRGLYCGMYVNELIVRLVGRGETNPQLFSLYESVLSDLSNRDVAIEQTLRRFEKYLLELCGYGLMLVTEGESGLPVDPEKRYFYQLEHGPEREKVAPDDIEISGRALVKLANDELLDELELQQTKQLMRRILSRYLGDKPLASRSLFV